MRFKLSIDVEIDGHYNSKVYTSGSLIKGRTTIKATHDVVFNSFEVAFTGVADTWVELDQQFISHRSRPFMKLLMPLTATDLAENRVLEAGVTYAVHFNFVVPHQLALDACDHGSRPEVREQHLRLPPTVGGWEGEDDAPSRVLIEYAIKVRVYPRAEEGSEQVKPVEGSHVIKVLPASFEDAPLDITRHDEWYLLTNSATIRKRLSFGKTGKLTATTTQPSAIMLTSDGRRATRSSARIDFDFSPSSSEIGPPKLGNVTGKLQSVTFYSAIPMVRLPSLGSRASIGANPLLYHYTINTLFTVAAGDTKWEPQETPGPVANYTATLDIPFTVSIPSHKILLPSFDNCLISRAYVLRLNLSAGPTNATISLAVPLQVGVVRTFDPPSADSLPSFESAMAEAEEEQTDTFLSPVSVPPPYV